MCINDTLMQQNAEIRYYQEKLSSVDEFYCRISEVKHVDGRIDMSPPPTFFLFFFFSSPPSPKLSRDSKKVVGFGQL
jgi:hypothetical protein